MPRGLRSQTGCPMVLAILAAGCSIFRYAERCPRGFLERHPRLFVLPSRVAARIHSFPDFVTPMGSWSLRQPVSFRAFLDDCRRETVWARSLVGWRSAFDSHAHDAPMALARPRAAWRVALLVTEMVDGLHQAAASNVSICRAARPVALYGMLSAGASRGVQA